MLEDYLEDATVLCLVFDLVFDLVALLKYFVTDVWIGIGLLDGKEVVVFVGV